ncbi:MAG: hypothetical protein C5B54_11035 [Acidobacteria bacterium]|nr:MAG: hypothetical protein C5B54_11035 [Acidobacteriota bacterium]
MPHEGGIVKKIFLISSCLLLVTSILDAALPICYISRALNGLPVSVLGQADGDQGDHVAWLNYNGQPTNTLRFIVKLNSHSPLAKNVTKFANVGLPGFVAAPFSFGPEWVGNLTLGPALFSAKSDFGTCKFPIEFVDNGFESTDVPHAFGPTVLNSTLVTSGIGTISSVIVSVYLQHPNLSEVQISLYAPDASGTTLKPVTAIGTSMGTGFNHTERTIFDDSASIPMDNGTAPYVGKFKPLFPLSVFNGKSGVAANGTWTLQVQDFTPGANDGILLNWALIIND